MWTPALGRFWRKMYEKINFYNIGSRLVSFQYIGQFPDQIGIAAVVPPLALHQVYHESVGCTTVEFRRPVLGKAPDKPEVCAFSIPFTWLFPLEQSLPAVSCAGTHCTSCSPCCGSHRQFPHTPSPLCPHKSIG